VDTGTRRLIFVDETGCNLNLARRYGRAPKGVRLVDRSVPRNTPVNRSLVGALSAQGLLTSMEVEGAIDGDAFFVFLEAFLGPCLRPGDVVLMDNLSTHKSARMTEAIQARGAEVIFLPRYSPDFNPIEGAWSKLKAYLRKVAARTPAALAQALDRGLAKITAANARGWFQHAGYRTP
jgi:transposase